LTDADSNELNHWSQVFLDKFKSLPEITDVATDREDAGPMLDVTVNREVASSYGILPSTIDNVLDDAFGQRTVSTIYTSLNQYHVVMEVSPQYQYGPDALSRIYVNSSSGQQVPLSTLVTSTVKPSPLVVNHQGMFPSTPGWQRAQFRQDPARRFEPRLFEPNSPLPGNGILRAETKRPESAVKVQKRRCRDRISLTNPAHSGEFGANREISVRPRVRSGGRSLYRTGLQPSNSLLAGKRTGNFAQSGFSLGDFSCRRAATSVRPTSSLRRARVL
jgi:hypothetical protein